LKKEELIAILIRTGTKGQNALQMAKSIVKNYDEKKLLNATYQELKNIHGVGSTKAVQILAALEIGKRLYKEKEKSDVYINSPEDVVEEVMSNKKGKSKLTFIDLFAGIGGFHKAMEEFSGDCVFASEIDDNCRQVYSKNFDIFPEGDITKIDEKDIPIHDILFAGFPCQPFSKGGFRKGFKDTRGTLFFDIERILKSHKPKYFLLENVSNLVTHDNGNTYQVIVETLKELGYSIPRNPLILSPSQFGVPALRKRIYIPGVLKESDNFETKFENLLIQKYSKEHNAYKILKRKYNNSLKISDYEKKVIKMWDDFYKIIDIKIIGFPVWSSYFKVKVNEISKETPGWKRNFILKNIELYERNKVNIDEWLKKYNNLDWVRDTHKKFEWQAGEHINSLYDSLIQFRPSGVRVKRPNCFSTLVAMNHNQIIGKFSRRAHPEELKHLQSLGSEFKLHKDKNIALRQLGNAVNVTVVKKILKIMLSE
jgi:DNA (cytosine-5)-methyltransferase 1